MITGKQSCKGETVDALRKEIRRLKSENYKLREYKTKLEWEQ